MMLAMTACAKLNEPPIIQTTKSLQTQYPSPIGVVLRDVEFSEIDGMVCMSADGYLDLADNTADITRWIWATQAQIQAYRMQVIDNNAQATEIKR